MRYSWTLLLIVGFAVPVSMHAPAYAQFRGGGGPPGGGAGGDFRQRMLQRMDRNGNGVLEPGEVDERARGFIDRMAQIGRAPRQAAYLLQL